MHVSSSSVVVKLISHVRDHALSVIGQVLLHRGSHRPEEFSQPGTERHVPALAEKLTVLFGSRHIVAQILAEGGLRSALGKQFDTVDYRIGDDSQLVVRVSYGYRMREVAEIITML